MIYDDNYPNRSTKPIQYITDDNGCWLCISHTLDKNGYPKIKRWDKTLRMSRYIYSIEYGEVPSDMVIMHKCDNPQCINPNHLQLGTTQENVLDKFKKGRFTTPRDKFGKFIRKA